jgi:hypothetical protein
MALVNYAANISFAKAGLWTNFNSKLKNGQQNKG